MENGMCWVSASGQDPQGVSPIQEPKHYVIERSKNSLYAVTMAINFITSLYFAINIYSKQFFKWIHVPVK